MLTNATTIDLLMYPKPFTHCSLLKIYLLGNLGTVKATKAHEIVEKIFHGYMRFGFLGNARIYRQALRALELGYIKSPYRG